MPTEETPADTESGHERSRPEPIVPDSQRDQSADPNRMLRRRSPVDHSDSALVSRDYRPRTGGPELITSWPLGPAPHQTEPGDDPWIITGADAVPIQQNTITLPYAVPVDHTISYLNATGTAYVDSPDSTLIVSLSAHQLEGKGYETCIEIDVTEPEFFTIPMIQFAPESETIQPPGHLYGRYTLSARVTGSAGYLGQGTAVQLWSE